MAYTVTPNVSESETGEVVTGFTTKASPNLHHGLVDPNNSDFVETDKGEVKHVMSEVEISDEPDREEEYWGDVIKANPEARDALDWAAKNYSQDFIDKYQESLVKADLDTFHDYFERILNDYKASNEFVEKPEEVDTEDDLSEQDQKLIDEYIDISSDEKPQGEESANQCEVLASQYKNSGNEVAAAMLMANAAFDRGEMTVDEATNLILNNYEWEDIKKNYTNLRNHVWKTEK